MCLCEKECGQAKDELTKYLFGKNFKSQTNFTTNDVDPLIRNHAIHWVLCQETYLKTKRQNIEGWELLEDFVDSVIYKKENLVIVAFRGTVDSNDIKNDIQLSRGEFDKAIPSTQLVEEFLKDTPDEVLVQVTGHSLGGAIARCVGTKLKLGIISFNGAAPPSNPQPLGENQINYHIAMDIISAWQPSVRIDKGVRIEKIGKFVLNLFPSSFFGVLAKPLMEAHPLDAFNNKKIGRLISVEDENKLVFDWLNMIPNWALNLFKKFTQTKQIVPLQ